MKISKSEKTESTLTQLIANAWLLIRAHQWWNYKIPLALGAAFAVALIDGVPYAQMIVPLCLVVLAGLSAGTYASVINDLTDLEQDRLAGKSTPIMDLTPLQRKVLFLFTTAISLGFGALIWRLPVSFAIFLSLLAVFTAYSVPPLRLKERGLAGIFCISVGEHLLPVLLSVSLVLELTRSSAPWLWISALAAWSAAFGLRGIIWHQLDDRRSDVSTGCATLAVRLGPVKVRRLAELIIFPVEVLSLLALLVLGQNWLAWLFLVVYAVVEWLRVRFMDVNMIIVSPKPYGRLILFEYYQVYFPLAYLFVALTKDTLAILPLTVYCLLFSAPLAVFVYHMRHIIRSRTFQPNVETPAPERAPQSAGEGRDIHKSPRVGIK